MKEIKLNKSFPRTLPIIASLWLAWATIVLLSSSAAAQTFVAASSADLARKIETVLPTSEEDAFLQIPWRLNIMKARVESLRTGKPMIIYEMNCNPLGHT